MSGSVRTRRPDEGFTLVELLVVVSILGVISAIFSSSMIHALQVQRRVEARNDVNEALTRGIERIAKAVRGASPLVAVSATQLTVENYRSGTRTRFTYRYDAAAHQLVESKSVYSTATAATPSGAAVETVLVRQLVDGDPVFQFYRRDGGTAAVPAEVAKVVVTLAAKPAEQLPYRLQDAVFLRNYSEG